MSGLMRDPLPISVSEFRKVTGKATAAFSDKQIEEFIVQLDFMAELFVMQVRGRKEKNNDKHKPK